MAEKPQPKVQNPALPQTPDSGDAGATYEVALRSPLEFRCPLCGALTTLTPAGQIVVAAKLRASGPAAREIIDCVLCGKYQWTLGFDLDFIDEHAS